MTSVMGGVQTWPSGWGGPHFPGSCSLVSPWGKHGASIAQSSEFFKRSQKSRLLCEIPFKKSHFIKNVAITSFLNTCEEDKTDISVGQMQPKSATL